MPETSTANMLARRARLLGPAYRLFYDEPFHPVRGEGVWLYDAAGTPWLAFNYPQFSWRCSSRARYRQGV